ncbi:geraniol 8-hydroxylase-like [Rutidosis leptorrhynchoides]|uniref:geraniol 8-hydroxylase-like n=1 Tax=Rutidosis leptorrhynchoides TaxID=125765 RepID=UPI003A99D8BA
MISELVVKIYITLITFWSWWLEAENEQDKLARTILTISTPALIFMWYKWMQYYNRNSPIRPLPPGLYGLPIVGYLPFLSSNVHEVFASIAHKYGPVFSLRLGSKLHVVVTSVDVAKVIVREQDHTFANRSPPVTARILAYGVEDIVWSNNTRHWRNMRKLLVSEVLSNTSLNASQIFRKREVRKMVNEVYTKLGDEIDINKLAFDTELNVVTSLLWGSSKFGEGDDLIDNIDRFREVEFKIIKLMGTPNISDFIPMLSRFDLQGMNREMQKQLEYLDQLFDKIIERKTKVNPIEEDGKKDFLQILLNLKDQKDDPTSFNITHVKVLLINILVAATDTTSTLVEWVMAEILHNPSVMEKVQDELTQFIGATKTLEESDLSKLLYLDAVIKETLRLHPPVPILIPRSPDKSCIVAGYLVPKGTTVFINVWAIHRDPKNWTDPLEFKPERFLNNKWDYNGHNLKYFPFGSGRRICPGIPLGEKMLMYILASLLHSFDWSLPRGDKLELSDEFGFVTKKRKPLIAIPTQRLSDANLYYD